MINKTTVRDYSVWKLKNFGIENPSYQTIAGCIFFILDETFKKKKEELIDGFEFYYSMYSKTQFENDEYSNLFISQNGSYVNLFDEVGHPSEYIIEELDPLFTDFVEEEMSAGEVSEYMNRYMRIFLSKNEATKEVIEKSSQSMTWVRIDMDFLKSLYISKETPQNIEGLSNDMIEMKFNNAINSLSSVLDSPQKIVALFVPTTLLYLAFTYVFPVFVSTLIFILLLSIVMGFISLAVTNEKEENLRYGLIAYMFGLVGFSFIILGSIVLLPTITAMVTWLIYGSVNDPEVLKDVKSYLEEYDE